MDYATEITSNSSFYNNLCSNFFIMRSLSVSKYENYIYIYIYMYTYMHILVTAGVNHWGNVY